MAKPEAFNKKPEEMNTLVQAAYIQYLVKKGDDVCIFEDGYDATGKFYRKGTSLYKSNVSSEVNRAMANKEPFAIYVRNNSISMACAPSHACFQLKRFA